MPVHPFEEEITALQALINEGPGAYPDSAAKARHFLVSIDRDRRTNSYVSEKVGIAQGDFEIWFSARRWNAGGDGGERVRHHLFADVSNLDKALSLVHRAQAVPPT